jgi:hypothetical protein
LNHTDAASRAAFVINRSSSGRVRGAELVVRAPDRPAPLPGSLDDRDTALAALSNRQVREYGVCGPMNAKQVLSAAGLLIVSILGANPVFGQQQRVTRPGGWPDAQTIIRQFLAGESNPTISTALATCPSQNPYGDTVWVALLERELAPILAMNLVAGWSSALRTCNDPRIEQWYRTRLLESNGYFAALPYLSSLLQLRSREDVEFLKQIAFDVTRGDELRSEILYRLSYQGTLEERLELYLDAYSRTRRLPDTYAYNAYHDLATSPVAYRILERGLAAVEEHPRNPNAGRLLDFISSDHRSIHDAAWRARVYETLRRIEANRQGRFPREMVLYARARREGLDLNPLRPVQAAP